MFNKVNAEIIAELARIVGSENVLAGPEVAEAMAPYAHDEVVGLSAEPEAVVYVSSAKQVSEIFQ